VSGTRKPVLLYVLSALTLLEGVALAATTIYLVVEIFAAPVASIGSAVALAVVVAVAAVALGLLARATLRGRPWIRGATICVAVLQLLSAYSILITKAPTVGWYIAVPAIALIVLVFTPPVLRATARPAREAEEDGRTF
jgi:amino acid transporter